MYDPLGFLTPVTLFAKMMQQEVCRKGCGWDDAIPQDILCHWKRWLEHLEMLAAYNVDRYIKPADFGDPIHAQLNNFADVSESGYGTVTNIRICNLKNYIHVALLLGKATESFNHSPLRVNSSCTCSQGGLHEGRADSPVGKLSLLDR